MPIAESSELDELKARVEYPFVTVPIDRLPALTVAVPVAALLNPDELL